MKRLLIFFFALASITAGAQEVDRVGNTPSQRTFFDGRLIARKTLALPNDTLAIPAGLRTYPWVAAIGDVIYLWSPTQLKWIAAGGGGGSTYTFSPPFSEVGGVVTLPGWNATAWDSVLNAVRTNVWLTEAIADGRYSLLGHQHDTLDFNGPMYRVGNNVYINYDSALFNARKLRGVTIATTAPANGQVLKYNSGSGQWEPAADNDAGSGAADGNNYPTSLDFDIATGNLTLGRQGLSTLTKNLDGRYLRTFAESDPFFDTSAARTITRAMITAWNNKQNPLPPGTSAQYWNATGALRPFSTDVLTAVGNNYIRNQYDLAQNATWWTSGPVRTDSTLSAKLGLFRRGLTVNAASTGSTIPNGSETSVINAGPEGEILLTTGNKPIVLISQKASVASHISQWAGSSDFGRLKVYNFNGLTYGGLPSVKGYGFGTMDYATAGSTAGPTIGAISAGGTFVFNVGDNTPEGVAVWLQINNGLEPIAFRNNGRIALPLLANSVDSLDLIITPTGNIAAVPRGSGSGGGSGVSLADRARWDSSLVRMEQLNDSTVRFHALNGQYWDLELDAGAGGSGSGTPQITNSAATSLTLSASTDDYFFTGNDAATWSMPSVSATPGKVISISNIGNAPLTITGSLFTRAPTNAFILLRGDSFQFQSNGTYWKTKN